MPTSSSENKEIVLEWKQAIKPKVVVDIGIGEGTYAKLARDFENNDEIWLGIEIFYPYVLQFDLEKFYHKIIISDVRYVDLSLVHEKPDLVIIGDVLEHMKKDEAKDVLVRLVEWAKNVIISVPLVHFEQGEHFGNPFETHIDHWGNIEMKEFLGNKLKDNKEGDVLGYYLISNDN